METTQFLHLISNVPFIIIFIGMRIIFLTKTHSDGISTLFISGAITAIYFFFGDKLYLLISDFTELSELLSLIIVFVIFITAQITVVTRQ